MSERKALVVDANVVISLLDELQVTGRTVLADHPDVTAFVPLLGLLETFGCGERTVRARIGLLGEIFTQTGGRLAVAADPRSAIASELQVEQFGVSEHPAFRLPQFVGMTWLGSLAESRRLHRVAQNAAHAKAAELRRDRTLHVRFHAEFAEHLNTNQAIERIEAATAPAAWAMQFAIGLGDSPISPYEVLAAPQRYPIVSALSHFAYRHMIANATAPGVGDQSVTLFKTRASGGAGDWFDAAIASLASRADAFVTADGLLQRRCEFLRERGLVAFQTFGSIDEALRARILR